jgi:hypothetical protein
MDRSRDRMPAAVQNMLNMDDSEPTPAGQARRLDRLARELSTEQLIDEGTEPERSADGLSS